MLDAKKCVIEDIIETDEGMDVYFQYPKDFSLSERFDDEEAYEEDFGPVIGMSVCVHIKDDDAYVSASPTCEVDDDGSCEDVDWVDIYVNDDVIEYLKTMVDNSKAPRYQMNK